MKNWLLVLLVSSFSGLAFAQTGVSSSSRGATDDAVLDAVHRSVENQLIVEEIEDAGFEIDVEEGFDEEWEEDIWVAAEADDVDANYVDPSESARFDLTDVPQADEVAEGWNEDAWENPELLVDAPEEAMSLDGENEGLSVMRGDDAVSEDDAISEDDAMLTDIDLSLEDAILLDEEADVTESNWWEESNDQWSAVIEYMDEDEFGADFDDEEDLDLLEEMYGTN